MYNSCKNNENINTIFDFKKILQKEHKKKHIVINDFNLHHSNWEISHVKVNVETYELIVTIKKYKLKKIISIELITWNKHFNENIIDFTYAISLFKNNIIKTKIDENINNHSNHRSIKTIMNLRIKAIESKNTRIWKKNERQDFAWNIAIKNRQQQYVFINKWITRQSNK